MKRSYKFRIYPTQSQKTRLENWFSMCRHQYNHGLKERKEAYEKAGKRISKFDQINQLKQLKVDRPWYKDVHSQVLQNVLDRLDKAFQNFFRRCKEGVKKEELGYPKMKQKEDWNSLTFAQFRKRPDPEKKELLLGKGFEPIRIQIHRPIPEEAKIKTLTIKKEGFKWFAVFSCEVEMADDSQESLDKTKTTNRRFLGIDLGLLDFFYDSSGSHVVNPRFFRKSFKQLKRFHRQFSKAVQEKKFDKRFEKIKIRLQNRHRKTRNQRLDFHHKCANDLLKKPYDVIVFEKLPDMKGRAKPKWSEEEKRYLPNGQFFRKGMNKSLSDAAWGQFLSIIKYKAQLQKKEILEVDPKYTSQICSNCGTLVKKTLGTRIHKCPNCHIKINRDHNAAINIERLGHQSLGVNP